MSDIALVTVNYNNAVCTLKLLNSLVEYGRDHLSDVVVVDNASADSDVAQIRDWMDTHSIDGLRVRLVRNGENLGYFPGLNSGLNELSRQPKKVIVCNNDLVFTPDFFTRLAGHKWAVDVFVVAPDIVTMDGVHQNPHAGRPLSWARKLSYAIYFSNYWVGITLLRFKRILVGRRKKKKVGPTDIYMGFGACYLLTPPFFEHCGRLDDRIFLWGEEPMLARQVREAGGRIVYEPDLIVKHLERGSTSRVPRKRQYLAARSSYRIYRHFL